jgi:plastocyanin
MKTLIDSGIRITAGLALLIGILSISVGCTRDDMPDMNGNGGDNNDTTSPGVNEVFIQNMAYNPSSLTVQANTTIKWTNKDGVAHTVTSDTGLFDSGSMNNGSTFSYTFKNPGTYFYHCTPHPSMTASVTAN